jgi:SAM-dependent methyltransferase
VTVRTVVADLEKGEFDICPAAWDVITICYYLQRNLIEPAKRGIRPEGILVVIVHTTEGDEQPTENRMSPGELLTYFTGWEILHHHEGRPNDREHRRAVAEIVARKLSS